MANKTELKKFVELKKDESIERLANERDELVKSEVSIFFEQHKKDLDFIKNHLFKSSNCFDALISDINQGGKGKYTDYYKSPVRKFNDLFGCLSITELSNIFTINSVEEIEKSYKNKIKDCKEEYSNLLAVISSMDAKGGVLVLKNLGFDTDNIGAPKQVTALSTKIDASKLFIQGETIYEHNS